ncbi:unnamed protein product [Adineta ricciae]|uniref:Uncharacterized protein n=1 Tax=Adineta ricciae TaxID=249248 RepID=A0A814ENU6_ADIRI|nr:unnamed protein product [Adineta ricciae]CAF1424570.1 unnamed protein product [Adineta ricciae]
MGQQNGSYKPDFYKYHGQDADYVIGELEKQGYTCKKYDTQRLVQARPLSPIPDPKTVHVYICKLTNTIHQIQTKY